MTRKNEWTLWFVAAACALHATDEYLNGWLEWAPRTFGISVPTSWFIVPNVILVVAALAFARMGWRRHPVAALVIPVATLANAVLFHIIPSLVQRSLAPGLYTAVGLYLPFSTWALIAARRDGVSREAMGMAAVFGLVIALGIVLLARAVS